MVREIMCLSVETYDRLKEELPRAINDEFTYTNVDSHMSDDDEITVNVRLSDTCILKSYEDMIYLDNGGNIFTLEPSDFASINIW